MFIPLSDITRAGELLEALDAAGFAVRASARFTPAGRFAGVDLIRLDDVAGVREIADAAAPESIGPEVGRVWFMRPANQDRWEFPLA